MLKQFTLFFRDSAPKALVRRIEAGIVFPGFHVIAERVAYKASARLRPNFNLLKRFEARPIISEKAFVVGVVPSVSAGSSGLRIRWSLILALPLHIPELRGPPEIHMDHRLAERVMYYQNIVQSLLAGSSSVILGSDAAALPT
jgi:hypothetical protein